MPLMPDIVLEKGLLHVKSSDIEKRRQSHPERTPDFSHFWQTEMSEVVNGTSDRFSGLPKISLGILHIPSPCLDGKGPNWL